MLVNLHYLPRYFVCIFTRFSTYRCNKVFYLQVRCPFVEDPQQVDTARHVPPAVDRGVPHLQCLCCKLWLLTNNTTWEIQESNHVQCTGVGRGAWPGRESLRGSAPSRAWREDCWRSPPPSLHVSSMSSKEAKRTFLTPEGGRPSGKKASVDPLESLCQISSL